MFNITRQLLVDKIHKRLEQSVKKTDIAHAVNIICDELKEELIAKRTISVKNFGTLTPYLHVVNSGVNIITGKIQKISPFWSVKFHPHDGFLKLVDRVREKFANEEKSD